MANETHTLNFFPVGNGDTTRIDLHNGRKVLFDYAHMRDESNKDDKRIDLKTVLKEELNAAKKDYYDVVAFTHLDKDHTHKSEDFFWLQYASKYQGQGRIKIKTIWAPAAALTEDSQELDSSAYIVQKEIRHRFKEGKDIVIFSRPDHLKEYCEKNEIDLEARKNIIYDAGKLAPGFTLGKDGVEFFIHAPMAWRQDEKTVIDRNDDCLVLQALFEVNAQQTSVLLTSDAKHETVADIVNTTKRKKNEKRLEWNVYKNPHHCSYLSIGPDKGEDKTKPIDEVKWLLETQGQESGIQIVSSDPIPAKGTAEDKDPQPPHREADAYYREVQDLKDGDYEVTMSYPKGATKPEPIRVVITSRGPELQKQASTSAAIITGSKPPRAGNGKG